MRRFIECLLLIVIAECCYDKNLTFTLLPKREYIFNEEVATTDYIIGKNIRVRGVHHEEFIQLTHPLSNRMMAIWYTEDGKIIDRSVATTTGAITTQGGVGVGGQLRIDNSTSANLYCNED